MRGRLAYAVDPVDGVAGTHNTPPLLWILRGKKGREARFVDLCDDVRER